VAVGGFGPRGPPGPRYSAPRFTLIAMGGAVLLQLIFA
jgi:hypothetical protein